MGARVVSTVHNGEYLEIPPKREPALLAAFEGLGISYGRDDDVAAQLEGEILEP